MAVTTRAGQRGRHDNLVGNFSTSDTKEASFFARWGCAMTKGPEQKAFFLTTLQGFSDCFFISNAIYTKRKVLSRDLGFSRFYPCDFCPKFAERFIFFLVEWLHWQKSSHRAFFIAFSSLWIWISLIDVWFDHIWASKNSVIFMTYF